jgi:hypothetical protein
MAELIGLAMSNFTLTFLIAGLVAAESGEVRYNRTDGFYQAGNSRG